MFNCTIFAYMNFCKSKLSILLLCGMLAGSCKTVLPAGPAKPQVASRPTPKPVTETPKITPVPVPKSDVAVPDNFLADLPIVTREFRGAWIATVANINWPTKNSLSTAQQKQEAIRILDMLQDANFNAVIFQARPAADALYKSDLEPWSYFLTGETGKAPSPYYDPLEFWIDEAHKRGMELHVWMNPYRAHHTTGGVVSNKSIARKMSSQTYALANGMQWLDPSDDEVQDHVSRVIRDVVKRYDIDALHIDDYFYPYKEYHGGRDFPDSRTWNKYVSTGGRLSRADWRRGNVNKFIKRIHDEIKAEKSYVKFGISPFGIWKPGYPAGISGSSQFDELYADAKLWLNEGWCDYFAPQLYWKDEGPQSFSALLNWWENENPKKIHLWPGLNTIGIRNVDKPTEIVKQINITRNMLGNRAGEIHYSVDGISKNPVMLSQLKKLYENKALVPLSPWIRAERHQVPKLNFNESGNLLSARWSADAKDRVNNWVFYKKYGDHWEYEILDANVSSKTVSKVNNGKRLSGIAVKSVDRLGNESEAAFTKF